MRAIRLTIDEYILDHKSQNHSPKTIEWHNLALGNLTDFLEKQEVTCVEQIERVHILSWFSALGSQPGAKGRMLSARTVNCYARPMRAFCRWLEAEGYVEAAPSNRVKMPKVGKPLIRIIEFDEFEQMLNRPSPQVLLELGDPNEDHVFLSESGFLFYTSWCKYALSAYP